MSRGKGRSQLFLRAPEGTRVYLAPGSRGGLRTVDIEGVPLPVWPNGRWCIEIAAYLGFKLTERVSLFNQGGTLGTYMSELTPIVRYCYANSLDFHRLSDAHFELFMRGLAAEKRESGEPVKSNTSRRKIGRRTLEFLDMCGRRRGVDDYVSRDGFHIQGYRKRFFRKIRSGRVVTAQYWHHDCFPEKDGVNRRNPVTELDIDALRKAAVKSSPSSVQRMRRLAIIRFLEATGARRGEVVNLRVEDVRAAKRMERPFVNLMVLKRRRKMIRKIFISHLELDFLLEYIDNYREVIVDACLKGEDHGFVFVNIKTGRQLVPNTITAEVYKLRKAAGIKGKAHPHLFRHRFFTMRVYRFIVSHKIESIEQFMQFCMSFGKLKIELMEESGLSSEESLLHYVNMAFALKNVFREEPSVSPDFDRIARDARAVLAELEAEREVLDKVQIADRMERALVGIVDELSRATKFTKEKSEGSVMLARAVGIE